MNITQKEKELNYFTKNNAGSTYIFAFLFTVIITIAFSFIGTADAFWKKMVLILAAELPFICAFLIEAKTTNAHKKIAVEFKQKTNYKIYLISVCFSIALIFCCLMFNSIFIDLLGKTSYNVSSVVYAENWWQLLICVVMVAVLPAFVEEIFFRGIIASGSESFGMTKAVVLSSLMFMFYHGSLLQTYFQFFLGVMLAIAILTTKDVKVCMTMHFTNNLTVLLLDYFGVEFAYNKQAWFIAVAYILLLVAIGLIFAYYFLMKKLAKKQTQKTEGEVDPEINSSNMIYITGFVIGAIYFVAMVALGFFQKGV